MKLIGHCFQPGKSEKRASPDRSEPTDTLLSGWELWSAYGCVAAPSCSSGCARQDAGWCGQSINSAPLLNILSDAKPLGIPTKRRVSSGAAKSWCGDHYQQSVAVPETVCKPVEVRVNAPHAVSFAWSLPTTGVAVMLKLGTVVAVPAKLPPVKGTGAAIV